VLSTKDLVEVTQGSGTRVTDPGKWNVIDSELVSLIVRRGRTARHTSTRWRELGSSTTSSGSRTIGKVESFPGLKWACSGPHVGRIRSEPCGGEGTCVEIKRIWRGLNSRFDLQGRATRLSHRPLRFALRMRPPSEAFYHQTRQERADEHVPSWPSSHATASASR